MVAARRRLMALWFVALLVFSVLPTLAPTAAAQAAGGTIGFQKAEIRFFNHTTGLYETFPVGSTRVVRPGDEINITVQLSVPQCITSLTGDTEPPSWVAVRPTNLLNRWTDQLIPEERVDDTDNWHNFTFRVRGNLTPGIDLAQDRIGLRANATCPTGVGTDPVDDGTAEAPAVFIDTRAPTLIAPGSAWTNSTTYHRVLTGSNWAGIWTNVTLNVDGSVADAGKTAAANSVLNPGLASVTVDYRQFTGAAPISIDPATLPAVTFAIEEASASFPTLNGAIPIYINATDEYGNRQTTAVNPGAGWTINVDNVRPASTALVTAATGASLTRSATAGAELTVRPTSTAGAHDATHALIRIHEQGQTPRWVGPVTLSSTRIEPLALDDPLKDWVNVSFIPVDRAGNLPVADADIEAVRRAVHFPENVTTDFGGIRGAPAAVTSSGIGWLFVNVSANGPTMPWTANTEKNMVARLERPGLVLRHWNVSQSDGRQDGDFLEHPVENPADPSRAGPTFVQPPPTWSRSDYFELSNFSGKAFKDNLYELRIEVRSPAGHLTRVDHRFPIDGTQPVTQQHRNYTAFHAGTLPNLSASANDLHGPDGNPIQFVLNVSDTRFSHGGFNDSKIRNITIELFDPRTGEVPLRANKADSLPLWERQARIDITPANFSTHKAGALPYLYDFFGLEGQQPGCGVDPHSRICVWNRLALYAGVPHSWMNDTHFTGWVNTTMSDLPPGVYKLRALVYDRAGNLREVVSTSPNENYRVAPQLKLFTSANSPFVTPQGTLEVTALASQWNATPHPNIANFCVDLNNVSATRGLCPVTSVSFNVSNSNDAASDGFHYTTLTAPTGPRHWQGSLTGYTGAMAQVGVHSNGTLLIDNTLSHRYFNYTPQPTNLPAGVVATQDVYVKAIVRVQNSAGTEVLVHKTEWVKAASAVAPAIKINYPPSDGAYNRSNTKVHLNVSFDRKVDNPTAPTLTWEVWRLGGTSPIETRANINPDLSGGALPRVLYNWTDELKDRTANAAFGADDYYVVVKVFDGPALLATQVRHFAILEGLPELKVDTTRDSPLRVHRASTGTHIVGRAFDIDLDVLHNFANFTSPSQLSFVLLRTQASGGQQTELKPGDDGFNVITTMESLAGDPTTKRADVHLEVTMPNGVQDGNLFQLRVTERMGSAPFDIPNQTLVIPLEVDLTPGTGSAFIRETARTILNPTVHAETRVEYNNPNARPYFFGFAEDRRAGVKLVEVRISSITDDPANPNDNRTFEFTTTGTGAGTHQRGAEIWMNNTFSRVGEDAHGAPVYARVVDVKHTSAGLVEWRVNLSARKCSSSNTQQIDVDCPAGSALTNDLYKPGANSIINISHRFLVEVRVTDNITQRTLVANQTIVTFDPNPPTLGSGGGLFVPSSVKSGITATPEATVDWRAISRNANLTVNVTDNYCVAKVRLKGVSEKNNNTTVVADMFPIGPLCPAGANMTWYLNLRDAPHMAQDVGNYTLWWEAEDAVGQISEIPSAQRTFKLRVVDVTPARVVGVIVDPTPGQAGGRSLIRADVFDDTAVSHVDISIAFENGTTLNTTRMRPQNVTADGVGRYVADTTEDLGVNLAVGTYVIHVTAYDVNWNRTQANGGPTCPQSRCAAYSTFYVVRDDGDPDIHFETPSDGATINATPVIRLRGLHKLADTASFTLRIANSTNATEFTTVPASQLNFTELRALNGTRQGYTIAYTPAGPLVDNTTLVVNATISVGSLVDRVQATYRVDAAPPTVTHDVTGEIERLEKTWAVSGTRVTLRASDTVSSSTTIRYAIGNGSEQVYTAPIQPTGADGDWRLRYRAIDAAGNAAPEQTLTLRLDQTGPRITMARAGDSVLLTADDGNGIGVNESSIKVHYAYGEAVAYQVKNATKVTSNSFQADLGGDATADGLRYYFTGEDLLGNLARSEYTIDEPFVIRKNQTQPVNTAPKITILEPRPETVARSSVTIRWTAEDAEEQPLTVSIAQRDPAPSRVIAPLLENTGSYTLNLSGYAAGAYTFVLTVTDGEKTGSDQVTFNVGRAENITTVVLPPPVTTPSQQVTVAVRVAEQQVASATYRLVKDGAPVPGATGLLVPSQGAYGAAFTTPSAPGVYEVEVEVVYAGGGKETKKLSSFTVAGDVTPPATETERPPFPVSLMALVAVAVLTVALAAYGAFGRWRK